MTADQVEQLWKKGYNPYEYYNRNPLLKEVVDMLDSGALGAVFPDIKKSLLNGVNGVADAYMTLSDFDDYVRAQQEVSKTYCNKEKFGNMSLINIAKAGIFSSDRAVSQYADNIWNIK